MRSMVPWKNKAGARRSVTREVDWRPLMAFVLLVGLLGFYAYQHWTTRPGSPLIGRARVIDGDSIEISGVRIRLEGIDAPEWSQTCVDPKGQTWLCGQSAAQQLRSYIDGRELTCARHGVDRYNRILAVCSVPDGADVNAWIVRQGWALASAMSEITAPSSTRPKRPSAASGLEDSCRRASGDVDTRINAGDEGWSCDAGSTSPSEPIARAIACVALPNYDAADVARSGFFVAAGH
jgi:Staphylococcal nuclease homologue